MYLGAIFAGGSVILQIVMGVLASLVLNEEFKGRSVVRAIVLFPYMLPAIVVVLLMRWLLNDTYGVIKNLMTQAGLGNYTVVWFSPDYIMLTLILISVWIYFPFVVMAVLARLQSIDWSCTTRRKFHGAGPIRRFIHVTLPQIRDILFVVILLRVIFMFTKFDLVWLLVGAGGIGYYVRTLPIYTFVTSFGELQVGAGAALSVMMFISLLVFAPCISECSERRLICELPPWQSRSTIDRLFERRVPGALVRISASLDDHHLTQADSEILSQDFPSLPS